jgi:hypothetical protein
MSGADGNAARELSESVNRSRPSLVTPAMRFVRSVVVIVVCIAVVAGCSNEGAKRERARRANGAKLASETEADIKLLDQQSSDAYTCAEKGGTFDSCSAWRGAADRALNRGQDLRVKAENETLTKACADQAALLSVQLIEWYDAVNSWRNSGNAAALKSRSSLNDLYRGSSMLLAACESK